MNTTIQLMSQPIESELTKEIMPLCALFLLWLVPETLAKKITVLETLGLETLVQEMTIQETLVLETLVQDMTDRETMDRETMGRNSLSRANCSTNTTLLRS